MNKCDNCGKEQTGITYGDFHFCSDDCCEKFKEDHGCMYAECPECGNGEDQPVHEQRWHMQSFEWLENTDDDEPNTARYKCLICGNTDCRSTFVLDSRDEIEDRKAANGE
jgi:hypothetical protein